MHVEQGTEEQEAILSPLNDKQREAATAKDGPIVVFAGAGSGKTRTISSRIALLLQNGTPTQSILAVTFTNKAAREMKERVIQSSPLGKYVLISTFHSVCARWLREFATHLGFTPDFTIYDDKDSQSLVKKIIQELNQPDLDAAPKDYLQAIGKAKTLGWSPDDAISKQMEYPDLFPFLGAQVYKRYQEQLARCNAMDFGDLLVNMLLLLKTNPAVQETMARRFQHVLVDEFQDTNSTQFELVKFLTKKNYRNLFVVGDDDQSIYSWRGANPTNILEFESHFPTAKLIYLEQNYRCTKNIVDAASSVIANNKTRATKTLWTDNIPGDPIKFQLEYDNETEAMSVIDQIVALEHSFTMKDIAIFYRTNAQSRVLEDALRRQKIPYQIFGSLKFYDRAEIKDVLGYLKLIYNPNDDVALSRVINVPTRGIGKQTVDDLVREATLRNTSLLTEMARVANLNQPRISKKFAHFIGLLDKWRLQSHLSPSDLVSLVLADIGYVEYLKKKQPDAADDKIANVHELGAAISNFESSHPDASLSQWLQEVSLVDGSNDGQGVSMMTLHSAKGLEFPVVFIVGVEDGLIPHRNYLDDPKQQEEERRLFYVGMTRARQKLFLLAARKRRTFNTWTCNDVSKFLKEIPKQLIAKDSFGDVIERSFVQLRRGDSVYHPTFGSGTISSMTQDMSGIMAEVKFRDFGRRMLNTKHLEKI